MSEQDKNLTHEPAAQASAPHGHTTAVSIITEFWAKSIPIRQFDWTAVDDNYEPGCPIGYGRTEQEAIDDLLEQLDEAAS